MSTRFHLCLPVSTPTRIQPSTGVHSFPSVSTYVCSFPSMSTLIHFVSTNFHLCPLISIHVHFFFTSMPTCVHSLPSICTFVQILLLHENPGYYRPMYLMYLFIHSRPVLFSCLRLRQWPVTYLIISPVSDRGMLWFYVEAARRPPPAMVLTR